MNNDLDDIEYNLIKKEIENEGLDEEETDENKENPFCVNDIDIVTVTKTIQQVCSRLDFEEIKIPDYQRDYVWNQKQRSRLIESILLKIPLPTFYIDAKSDTNWLVIDGLQRLTTIYKFYKNEFALQDLEYLDGELAGKKYDDFKNEDDSNKNLRKYLRRFDETELLIYLVKPNTPKEVALNIFGRINTLGSPLSQQELRHALYQGKSTKLLELLSSSEEFIQVITRSSYTRMKRMSDRELILRLLAIKVNGIEKYNGNIGSLLNATMNILNNMSDSELNELKDFFLNSMKKAYLVFGNLAFRKIYLNDTFRRAVNKPLFETIGLQISKFDDNNLIKNKEKIVERLREYTSTNFEYDNSLSFHTNSKIAFKTRMNIAENLFSEVLND